MWCYFKENEFKCKCGCGGGVKHELIDLLDAVRARRGCPIYVTSGFRCAQHNAEVGGVRGSYHTRGLAADIVPDDGSLQLLAAELRAAAPTGGIIIYKRSGFIHFDLRRTPYFEVCDL